jgi:hypothetical protein
MGLILSGPRSSDAPFVPKEFKGYFRWNSELSERYGDPLYHACHEQELAVNLAAGCLLPRSDWEIEWPGLGVRKAQGVWAGLNDYYARSNHYGPCLITLPVTVLDGRSFLVFNRPTSPSRNVYTFVQHDSPFPIWLERMKDWKEVQAEVFFQRSGPRLYLRRQNDRKATQDGYRVLLTSPLPLAEASYQGVPHGWCAVEGCSGATREQAIAMVNRVCATTDHMVF